VNRTWVFSAAVLAALLSACDDPEPPEATPDRRTALTAAVTASSMAAAAPTASTSATPEAAPSASAEAEPSASPSGEASAAPSGSASAAPVAAKGFAFPSPKSGVLSPAEAEKLAPAGGHAKVRVLDPGQEPLARLAYTPAKDATQALRFDISMKMDLTVEGETAPKLLNPPQSLDVDMVTEQVDEKTGALVAMVIRGVTIQATKEVDQDTASAITKQLGGVSGLTFHLRVSPQGEGSEPRVDVPAAFPKGAEQLVTNMGAVFREMMPRLPDEPIGIGAKWQVLSREAPEGANLVQLTEYTLKERSGSKITLDFHTRQLAASGAIKLAGTPAGASTKLSRFAASVTGSLAIDTKQMGPVKGRLAHETRQTIDSVAPVQDADADAGAGAGTKQVKTNLDIKSTAVIARRAAAAAAKP
jgi:hypothetical protein